MWGTLSLSSCALVLLALLSSPLCPVASVGSEVVRSVEQLVQALQQDAPEDQQQPALALQLPTGPLSLDKSSWPADGVVPRVARVQLIGAGWGLEQGTLLDFSMLPKVS